MWVDLRRAGFRTNIHGAPQQFHSRKRPWRCQEDFGATHQKIATAAQQLAVGRAKCNKMNHLGICPPAAAKPVHIAELM
jgi:hypothetical protein